MRKDCSHEEKRQIFRAQGMATVKRKDKQAINRNAEAADYLTWAAFIHKYSFNLEKTCLGAVEYHAAQFICNHIFVLFDCAILCKNVSKVLPDQCLPGESRLKHLPLIFSIGYNRQSVARQLV
jgi:hypothetical protein